MGINSLLAHLKSAQVPSHMSQFKGQRVAVDGYVWLHRGAFAHAEDLTMRDGGNGKYADYLVHMTQMMLHYGVQPVLVFDGGPLPSKKRTEGKRAAARAEALAAGRKLFASGRKTQALEHLRKAVDITPDMAREAQHRLEAMGVEFIVAPYEADAQLAYFAHSKYVDALVTEDSDLLVYGVQVPILYKLDRYGACAAITPASMLRCSDLRMDGWAPGREIQWLAVLVGCDYCEGVQGLGVKKASLLIRRYAYPVTQNSFQHILRQVRAARSFHVPTEYEQHSRRALLTFAHQRVYCPRQRKLVHVTSRELDARELSPEESLQIGEAIDDATAMQIATGKLHPVTREPFNRIGMGPVPLTAPRPPPGGPAPKHPRRATPSCTTIHDFFGPKVKAASPDKKRRLASRENEPPAPVVSIASTKRRRQTSSPFFAHKESSTCLQDITSDRLNVPLTPTKDREGISSAESLTEEDDTPPRATAAIQRGTFSEVRTYQEHGDDPMADTRTKRVLSSPATPMLESCFSSSSSSSYLSRKGSSFASKFSGSFSPATPLESRTGPATGTNMLNAPSTKPSTADPFGWRKFCFE